jgi:glyoxylase-like metal-dependent hydrolase (beta-lactamase superfamily II)
LAPIRLARGVYLILYPGLATPLDSIVGLLVGARGALAIDAGSGLEASIRALAASLAVLGLKPSDVKAVFLTHAHVTNSGGAYWFHSNGAIIAAHYPDSIHVTKGDREAVAANDYNLPYKPTPVGLEVREETRELEIAGYKIVLLHTPGHTMESISLVLIDKDGNMPYLFSGDALFIGDVGRPDLDSNDK